MRYNRLTDREKMILEKKGTEVPFSGEYDNFFKSGVFVCRKCNAPLFSSESKFDAGCGWPAFDGNLAGEVLQISDPDGMRTEIRCASCGGHLGHAFSGERLTANNIRHCVNSLSLKFIPEGENLPRVI